MLTKEIHFSLCLNELIITDLTILDCIVSIDWLYPTAIQIIIILTQWYLSPHVKHLAFWKGFKTQLDTPMEPAGLRTFLWCMMGWALSVHQAHIRFWERS